MVTVSCSGKFHAFALAEQLDRHEILRTFYTTYANQKNTWAGRWVKRADKENINPRKIQTRLELAVLMKLQPEKSFRWNNLFDKWVSRQLNGQPKGVFIGWSGMSLASILKAKALGWKTIVERGSSHIVYQDAILKEEYARFGKTFSIHPAVIEKELAEYAEADFISIPSYFVKRSFLEKGVPEQKLLLNPYGASGFFKFEGPPAIKRPAFRLVYLGTLSFRKGLVYLFEALQQLSLPEDRFEVWFIGSIDEEFSSIVNKYKKANWQFFGHVNHYELGPLLGQCDVGVQPSLEEGLSMVIPQMMSCGLPVIVTPNSGGENMVQDGINGYVVPIRDPLAIAKRIVSLFENPQLQQQLSIAAAQTIQSGFTWKDYGDRYTATLNNLLA